MKKALLLASITLLTCLETFGQTATIPEFKNKVFSVNTDNTLSEIENADLQTEYKAKLTGSGSVLIKTNGTTSSIKKPGEQHFIVKTDQDTDPSEIAELFKFDVQKKTRSIVITTVSSLGETSNTVLPKQKLKFTKIENGVWDMAPETPLAKGEYFFIINRPNIDVVGAASGKSMKGYCFSVE